MGDVEKQDIIPNGPTNNIEASVPLNLAGTQSDTRERLAALEFVSKLDDPLYLPSREELISAFKILRLDAWHNFQFAHPYLQEILTIEYVNALTDYLVKRLETYSSQNKEKPLYIVELGAGNGRLSYFIRENLKSRGLDNDIQIVATDIMPWDDNSNTFPVELPNSTDGQTYLGTDAEDLTTASRADSSNDFNTEVLEKYKPTMVILSWPARNIDITVAARRCESVQEYIIIGDDEACGDTWDTFGLEFASPDPEDEDLKPAFETDGFKKINLPQLSALQTARPDYVGPGKRNFGDRSQSCSQTNSFRRVA